MVVLVEVLSEEARVQMLKLQDDTASFLHFGETTIPRLVKSLHGTVEHINSTFPWPLVREELASVIAGRHIAFESLWFGHRWFYFFNLCWKRRSTLFLSVGLVVLVVEFVARSSWICVGRWRSRREEEGGPAECG